MKPSPIYKSKILVLAFRWVVFYWCWCHQGGCPVQGIVVWLSCRVVTGHYLNLQYSCVFVVECRLLFCVLYQLPEKEMDRFPWMH